MSLIDLPPKPEIWLSPKPAIIRPADDIAVYEANLGTLLCAARRRSAGGAALVSLMATTTDSSTTGLSTYTFSSKSIGAAPSAGEKRYIVVAASTASPSGRSITGVSITGSAGTEAEMSNGSNTDSGIFYREVPSGTTGDIVVTITGGTVYGAAITVYRIIITGGAITVHDTTTSTASPLSWTLNVPVGGVYIAAGSGIGGANPTWTELTEDHAADLFTSEWAGHASKRYTSAQSSVNATGDLSSATNSGAAVTFGAI